MVEATDIENLLATGTWSTQKTGSPRPSNPIRANQSSKLEPLDPRCPRSISSFSCIRTGRPPPPSVEDEVESLAKECDVSVVSAGDEEPKCRGDIDQLPLMLEVPDLESNCERRYVILTPSETTEDNSSSDGSQAGQKPDLLQRTEYTANTKIQLDPHIEKDARSAPQRRKSRGDLPKLETHVPSTRPKTPSEPHRTMSATSVPQKVSDERDYFSPHAESARPAGDAYLSPVIKHATKGRDRAYWNFNSGSTASSPRASTIDLKPSSSDRKGTNGYAKSSHLSRPTIERRTHSAMDVSRESRKTTDRHSLYKDESFSRSKRSVLPSPPLDPRPSSSRSTRRDHSPARSHREKPKLSRRKSSHKHRSSPSREKDDGYSSDERDHKSHRSHRHRRKSLVVQEDRPSLPSPAVASIKSKSRAASPLPSPRPSRGRSPDYTYEANPRSSTATLVKRRTDIERPVSPMSSGSSSSPRSRSRRRADSVHGFRPRALSRSPSVMSTKSISKTADVLYGSAPLSMMFAAEERKRHTMPPSPAYSRQGSLEDVHRPNHNWQPEPLCPTPRQSATNLERPPSPIVSFRRFSEDVNAGINPGLPICPRQRPRAGYPDWLTLPKSENFNICPTCYEQVFYATEFRDLFVPASSRSKEREIVCDFGTSTWYRSAWLMTLKYHLQDLRLLQGVADVMARERVPCYGNSRVSRVWYSITDPATRRCIPDFKVCSPCAKAVEVIFPSLTGIFVPLDRSAEAKSGKCSLHFAPKRNRFLTYFDTFEKCHDRAMAERLPPDSKRLALNIHSWSEVEECPQDKPLRYDYWYTMQDIPEMTVCEECFLDVVYPELVADMEARTANGSDNGANSVARNFYHKPHLIRSSTVCRMSSPRMRQVFKTACRKEKGILYMDEKVRERLGTF